MLNYLGNQDIIDVEFNKLYQVMLFPDGNLVLGPLVFGK